jgi:2-dehydropantoate 2-reductase
VDQKLGVLCIGTGAIGTYIGGSLALSGHRVTFIDRTEVIALVKQRGLSLDINGELFHVANAEFSDSIEEGLKYHKFDLCLFALKSYDTDAAISAMIPYREKLPPILCLQNGVENEAKLAKEFGAGKVIAGTVTSSIGKKDAGIIVLEKQRGIGIASGHPIVESLVNALNSSNLAAKIYPDASQMKWSKLLTNLLANASSAILDMTPAEILAHPGLFRIEMMQLREALEVMDKQGIHATDLPGTPVRLLAFTAQYLPLSLARILLTQAVAKGRGEKMPSFHIDLYSQRGKSEVSYLNGSVARFGNKLGVPTPVNSALTEILQDLTEQAIPLTTYAHLPEKLIEKISPR